jgi:hypothetical protein
MADFVYNDFTQRLGISFNKVNELLNPIVQRLIQTDRPPIVMEAEQNFNNARDDLGSALQARKKKEVLEVIWQKFYSASQTFVTKMFNESDIDFSDFGFANTRNHLAMIRKKFEADVAEKPTRDNNLTTNKDQNEKLIGAVRDAENKLNLAENRIEYISQYLAENADPFIAKAQALEQAYKDGIGAIGERRKEIDELAAAVGGAATAGTYAGQAVKEESTADNLRAFAVVLMIVVLGIAGYSFFEATKTTFNVQSSLLRLAFALMLSVPAAYLARESAKHRDQQYRYLQTSLELHAISPYVATLPEEIQHSLKKELATKIFVNSNWTVNGPDSYPINMQELGLAIVSAIGKLNEKKDDKKSDSKNKKGTSTADDDC